MSNIQSWQIQCVRACMLAVIQMHVALLATYPNTTATVKLGAVEVFPAQDACHLVTLCLVIAEDNCLARSSPSLLQKVHGFLCKQAHGVKQRHGTPPVAMHADKHVSEHRGVAWAEQVALYPQP